jgi:arabinofuranosyltransferase
VFVLLALPPLVMLATGWSHRWTSDDGFINVRIVNQIFDGHGPVFNRGERVEAASSAAWLGLLVVGRVVFFWLPVEWVAVLLGVATTVFAVVVAEMASIRLFRTRLLLPFGVLVFIALPPVWDFATAGLETGLTLLWIAGSQYALVHATQTRRARHILMAATTIGLGPLVRPDLLVMMLVFLAALVVVTLPHSRRDLMRIGIAALAIPALYEMFRIAYYGALVPNTAFAKEATSSNWRFGRLYLEDFVDPYELWIALLLFGLVFVVFVSQSPAPQRLLLAAPVVAGVLHGFFVTRGGGDHMHGRMLLPALFALMLPVAAIPIRTVSVAALAGVLLWSAIPVWSGGPGYVGTNPDAITNERTFWVRRATDHPVTADEFRNETFASAVMTGFGNEAADRAQRGERSLLPYRFGAANTILPLRRSVPYDIVITMGAIGMLSVTAGTDVYVADRLGIADPIASRIKVEKRGRPGHEKFLPVEWFVARFARHDTNSADVASPAQVAASREALQCPVVRRMLARSSAPLSLGRIAHNVVDAFRDFDVRISRDPAQVARSCGR